MREIYFAGGCFWGAEHYLKQIHGVVDTDTGFANGKADIVSPTYEEVYTDQTGYAETVRVRYDERIVGLRFLTRMFFRAIDPTSLNQQGEDRGTRYRTGKWNWSPCVPTIRPATTIRTISTSTRTAIATCPFPYLNTRARQCPKQTEVSALRELRYFSL